MTYNVFGEMLNFTQPQPHWSLVIVAVYFMACTVMIHNSCIGFICM